MHSALVVDTFHVLSPGALLISGVQWMNSPLSIYMGLLDLRGNIRFSQSLAVTMLYTDTLSEESYKVKPVFFI